MNGDGRADVMCVANDGGVAVWLSKEGSDNLYETSSEWTDARFGFCPKHDLKQVILDFIVISRNILFLELFYCTHRKN